MADETEQEGLSEVEIALIDALKVGYRDGDEVMQETASEGTR